MKIAVFFGGKSVEHDISIITALQTMKAISKENSFIPVYIKSNGKMVTADNLTDEKIYLDYEKNVKNEKDVVLYDGGLATIKKKKINIINIECALLCCHGHGGEDGSLQGALEISKIPYTSCDCCSSVLCMDKGISKFVLESNGLPSIKGVYFNKCKYVQEKSNVIAQIDKIVSYPCIIKPATLGSSVGILICEDKNMLEEKLENAFNYDDKILVEKYLSNAREFCCAVIKNSSNYIASNVVEVSKSKIYTFEEKYLSEKSTPKNKISPELEQQIKNYAKEAYKVFGCSGVVRVDFLFDNGKLYVNELNSIPGSLSFNMFKFSFADIINCLLREGVAKYKEKDNLIYKFNSQAIEKYIELTEVAKK